MVVSEVGDGGNEKNVSLLGGWSWIIQWKEVVLSCDHSEKTLGELGSSVLEMSARAMATETGPHFKVEPSAGMVHVPPVGSSAVQPDIEAVRMQYYTSQSAKSFSKDFF